MVFTTLNTIIEEMENTQSDLSNSDDNKEKSHLQFEETDWSQGMHQITSVIPNKNFMFNKTSEKSI